MKLWNVTIMKNNSLLDKFINPCVTSLPKCDICKHFIVDNDPTKYSCKAFPNDIPDDVIWENEEKECCNGIFFEEE